MDFKRFLVGPKDKDDFRKILRSQDDAGREDGSRPGSASSSVNQEAADAGRVSAMGSGVGRMSAAGASRTSAAGVPRMSAAGAHARTSTGDGNAFRQNIMPAGSKFLGGRNSQSSPPAAGVANQAHSDSLHNDVLSKVRQTFLDADDDGSGRLAPDEFVKAFMGILQTEDGGDEEALLKLFCRIDANSDGTIDWDEFSSYMLLESQGSASIRELESAINFLAPEAPPVPEAFHHRDLMTNLSHITMANGADRYISCGKDGVVKVWNAKDMKPLRSIVTGKSWVTCAKLLPLTNKLAVSSFNRSMKIYDMQTFEMCGQIPEIDYAPMAMDVWVPLRNKDVEMVVFGDGGGFVRLYEIRINPLEEKNSSDRYIDTPKWKFQHHSDWVTSVKYVEDMNCVIAGSLDKFVSMTDAEERVPLKVLEGHTKGVTTVDWSPIYKFVCSGGQDRRVFLWNPFSQKPLAQLLGHASSVQQVLVNDRDNQIISLGSDKVVKVWDIRNHKCLQTIQDKEIYKLDDTLLAMTFDQRRKQLLTGNLQPKVWRQIVTTSGSAGHRDPVSKVIYNPLFGEAISADHGGTVSVWHVPTGKLRFRFYNAHGDQRITAMNFDAAKRRLLTGAENGEVKVWNFSSGACLSQLKARSHQEVTSVVAVRGSLMRHFLVAGWDRKVTFFDDSGLHEVGPGRSLKGHNSDVLDMALMDNFPALVTACDDGEIWSWNIDSGAPRRIMVPEFRSDTPPNEKAVEAVCFLHGKMRHILVAVYADRMMRLWDIHTGVCLLEVFTGHRVGETVLGLSVDPTDQRIATADSAGFIKMWDSSGLEVPASASGSGSGFGELNDIYVWRGHKSQVTSLHWAELPTGRYLLSSSHDKAVKIWTQDGILIGTFGMGLWQLDQPSTWQGKERQPLEEVDAFDMEMSRLAPGRPGKLSNPSTRHLSKQYSFVSVLEDSAANEPSPKPAERSPYGAPSRDALRDAAAAPSPRLGSIPLPSRPSASREGGAGVPSPRSVTMSVGGSVSRPGTSPAALPQPGRLSGMSPMGRGNHGRVGSASELKPSPLSPQARGSGPGRLQSSEPEAQGGYLSSAPGPAPASPGYREVAKVMAASHRERLMRVGSARRRDSSVAQSAEPSPCAGITSGLEALGRGDSQASQAAGSERTVDAELSVLAVKEDDDDGESVVESEVSSEHASDEDVPLALWMEEFQASRKGRHKSETSSRGVYLPRGNQALNFPNSPGRKDGVYHLMHIAEPSKLPDRPATSFSASRSGRR